MSSAPETGKMLNMLHPGSVEIVEYPLPNPTRGDLLVRVERSNVCGSELHIWQGKHPVKRSGGLGHEFVGRVISVGANAKDSRGEAISIGDRVTATYFQTCMKCAQCAKGNYSLCDNAYRYFAQQPSEKPHFISTFASHYYIHATQHVFKVPTSLPNSVASMANCAVSQVLYGLDVANISSGDTVAIQGAGGLGIFGAIYAKSLGCKTIVIDAAESRIQLARQLGLDGVVNRSQFQETRELAEAVAELCGGDGPDLLMEVVGAPAAFAEGLEILKRGGRYLVMGNLSPGATVEYDPGLMTRKSVSIYHVDRYDGRYLGLALEFLHKNLDRLPNGLFEGEPYDLKDVESALDDSISRTVGRAAIYTS